MVLAGKPAEIKSEEKPFLPSNQKDKLALQVKPAIQGPIDIAPQKPTELAAAEAQFRSENDLPVFSTCSIMV